MVQSKTSVGVQVVHRDPSTGAPTLLFRVQVDRGTPWPMAQHLLSQAVHPPIHPTTHPQHPGMSPPGTGTNPNENPKVHTKKEDMKNSAKETN